MNHSSARIHDVWNIAEPLGPGWNEQGLAGLADHPAGVLEVEQGCADAILAHRANTMSQQQPSSLGFEWCTTVADLDHLPGVFRSKHQAGLIPDAQMIRLHVVEVFVVQP